MPNDLSTLSDVELAILCATEVLGWTRVEYANEGVVPVFACRAEIVLRRTENSIPEDWRPYKDARAWWDIVEAMCEKGWNYELHRGILGHVAMFGHEYDSVRGCFADGACWSDDKIGRVVMVASLKAVRGTN